MKGIMVPLLIFLTTGIVVGQQSNSSNNAFNPNTSSRANDGSAGQNLLKPLEISVTARDLVAIRSGRAIVAKVEAKDSNGRLLNPNVISGISLFRQENNVNALPKVRMQGQDLGNGILQFALTDNDLFALDTKQLVYDFTFAERGKFKEVEVFYVGNQNSVDPGNGGGGNFSPNTPAPDNGQNAEHVAFGPRNGQNQTPFIPLPAPAEPGEVDFMGPAMPPGPWVLPEQDAEAKFAQWRAEQAEKKRQQEAAELAEARRQEQSRIERQLAEWRAKQAKTNLMPIDNPPATNNTMSFEQRQKAFELEQREKLIASKESSLLRKQSLVDAAQKQFELDQKLALDRQRYLDSIRTANPQDVNPNLANPAGPTSGQHFYPNTNGSNLQRNDRFASTDYNTNPLGPGTNGFRPPADVNDITPQITNRGGGINKFAAAIPGQKNDGTSARTNTTGVLNSTRDDRVDGFVLFLLLCSLGLNMYLAFISRGFYVRYHELADELRETFSATL